LQKEAGSALGIKIGDILAQHALQVDGTYPVGLPDGAQRPEELLAVRRHETNQTNIDKIGHLLVDNFCQRLPSLDVGLVEPNVVHDLAQENGKHGQPSPIYQRSGRSQDDEKHVPPIRVSIQRKVRDGLVVLLGRLAGLGCLSFGLLYLRVVRPFRLQCVTLIHRITIIHLPIVLRLRRAARVAHFASNWATSQREQTCASN